jgi:hypothetical protein
MDHLRIQLIERLCRLPPACLAEVETLLNRLQGLAVAATDEQGQPAAQPANTAAKDWPHAPVHRLSEHGTYIVTASTQHKAHVFATPAKLSLLEDMLLRLAKQQQVVLEAWAVFSNHYHFVAHTTGDKNQLAQLLGRLHYDSAEAVNH